MGELPAIIITGASGFIGSHLVSNLIDNYRIYAIARRSLNESQISYHPNLFWLQCDITNKNKLEEAFAFIQKQGGADYLIHLAAYYDFTYKDHPAYNIVNINGTRNVLELSKELNLKRFIFASSVAACNFPENGKAIDEKSSPDADYHYAKSKKEGERMVKEYSAMFPCAIVRFAAVFSDWCEYAPLYKFLLRWLSKSLISKIIAGAGESAVPYIHINDLCQLFVKLLGKSVVLPQFDVYNCSPSTTTTSHNEIFAISTRYSFGESSKAWHLPEFLVLPALLINKFLDLFRSQSGKSFEQFWMINYIDKKLGVDSDYTQKMLEWEPTPRFLLPRRLPFILEKMKSHPSEWLIKNEVSLIRMTRRPNYLIYEKMLEREDKILNQITEKILKDTKDPNFQQYQQYLLTDFLKYISTLFHLMLASVRSGDRGLFLDYIEKISMRRFSQGILPNTIGKTLKILGDTINENLADFKELKKYKQELYDNIVLTLQVAQDEVEDLYESLLMKIPNEESLKDKVPECAEIQDKIRQLSSNYQVSPDEYNPSEAYLINNLK